MFDETASFVEAVAVGFPIKAGTLVASHHPQRHPLEGADIAGRGVDATVTRDGQVFAFVTPGREALRRRRRA